MNNSIKKFNLDIFIQGENIDLCIPNEEFARNSSWYSWFNNPKTTRFLRQGIFPNTPKDQVEFYNSLKTQDRLSLIISDRKIYIGTISLSFINLYKRTAEIAMLIGEESDAKNADFMALEAMALITKHAFEMIGLKRISGGQHRKLWKWQRILEIIGYRIDGIKKGAFLKGPEEADSVSISITYTDYNRILSNRVSLWDNGDKMRARISLMPKEPFVIKLRELLENEGEKYYDQIFKL